MADKIHHHLDEHSRLHPPSLSPLALPVMEEWPPVCRFGHHRDSHSDRAKKSWQCPARDISAFKQLFCPRRSWHRGDMAVRSPLHAAYAKSSLVEIPSGRLLPPRVLLPFRVANRHRAGVHGDCCCVHRDRCAIGREPQQTRFVSTVQQTNVLIVRLHRPRNSTSHSRFIYQVAPSVARVPSDAFV